MFSCLFVLGTSNRVHNIRQESNNFPIGTVTTELGLKIRTGPSTDSEQVGFIPYNGKASILGGRGEWWAVSYQGEAGYVFADFISVDANIKANGCLNMRKEAGQQYGVVTCVPNGAVVKVTRRANDEWYRVVYGNFVGYCSSRYVKLISSGSETWPPSEIIRQTDSRFNYNIRKTGCAFMSLCWCNHVNSVSGCNELYDKAIRIGGMKSTCYILNWDTMKQIAGASTYRYGGARDMPRGNEKEILECRNSRTTMHFVVGDGHGAIEYDPEYVGFVSYGNCVSKRFYGY